MYILNEEEQEALLRDMSLVDTSDEGWTKTYLHAETGDTWTLYYPYAAMHGGGPRYLRRGPIPDRMDEWVWACLISGQEDNVVGAATDLVSQPEKWDVVLDTLEAKQNNVTSDLIRLFIEKLGILNPINRYPVVGKRFEEVAADGAHFRALARRSAALINHLSKR